MAHHSLLALLASAILLSACDSSSQEAGAKTQESEATPPPSNILFVLVDDLGWRDLGFMGSEWYETPNIDKLVASGTIFSAAYSASPVCSPSRAALMTGLHPARIKITDWIPGTRAPQDAMLKTPKILNALPKSAKTLAEQLKTLGYTSGYFGKWHLGGDGSLPEDHGFDLSRGSGHWGQPPAGYYAPFRLPGLSEAEQGEYLTDRLTAEAIAFMRESTRGPTDERPFLAFLSFYTVHTPIHRAPRHYARFTEDAPPRQQVEHISEGEALTKTHQDDPRYASMLAALDDNIGLLLDFLDNEGLADNTLVIFTSDNGGLSTLLPGNNQFPNGLPTSNLPLRAGKGWVYEGGIRVPLVIRVPRHPQTNWARASSVSASVTSMDLYASVLAAAGIEDVDGDGRSLLPDVLGTELPRDINERSLLWHFPHYHASGSRPSTAIRQGPWKLVRFYESGRDELYNLLDDPGEAQDLAGSRPSRLTEMQGHLDAALRELNADLPVALGESREA